MSVLVVTPSAPWPPTHGAAMRNSAFITALSKCYDVEVIALRGPLDPARAHPDARTTKLINLRLTPWPRRLASAAIGRTAQLVYRHLSQELRTAVQERLSVGDVEAVQVEGLQLAHIVNDIATSTEGSSLRPRVVYDAHNVEWRLQSYLANQATGARAWYSRRQAALLFDVEQWVVRAADVVVASSAADAVSLELLGSHPVTTIPHPIAVPAEVPDRNGEADMPRVLLAANFAYRPNILGAEWLFGSVWPAVLQLVPNAGLRVVGAGSLNLRTIAPARCSLGGFVDDIQAEYRRAWVGVSPAPIGSGAPLKVLESLAHGRPVVARPEGLAGLPDTLDGVAVASSAEAFASELANLLQSEERRCSMGRAGHAYVAECHEPSSLGDALLDVHAALNAGGS